MEIDGEELAPKFAIGEKEFLCVEYPGYVKNVDRMLETLGGEKSLSQLRYRPNDSFSHPINGDIVPTARFLLKVTRRIKRGSPPEDAMYKTEIIGSIPKTYRFRGLADFQYIVPKTDKIGQLKNAMMTGNVRALMDYRIADDDDNMDDLRSIPPPLFTVNETPFQYNYTQNAPVVRVRVRQPDGSYEIRLINRSRGYQHVITAIYFEEENVPSSSEFNLKELNEPDEIETRDKIKQLFEDRPIWLRGALKNQIPIRLQKHFVKCLVHIAYTFHNGPWRDTWVKYGVDPRQDKKYASYQPIDSRRFTRHNANTTGRERAKRQTVTERQSMSVTASNTDPEDNSLPEQTHIFDGIHISEQLCTYQLCDITIPAIQSVVYNEKYITSTCRKYPGFYYRCVFDRIRNCVRSIRNELAESGQTHSITDIEHGLGEEIAKELEELQSVVDDQDDDTDQEEDDTQLDKGKSRSRKDKSLAKQSLADMADEYMTRLSRTQEGTFEYDVDFGQLEDFDELDGEEAENEDNVQGEPSDDDDENSQDVRDQPTDH